MGLKSRILSLIEKYQYTSWLYWYYKCIKQGHKRNEKRRVYDKKDPIYYIIGYEDTQRCGWSVWERVVLYNCIYAEDHNMIPVVDMKNNKSIYQIANENVWEQYYALTGDVSLEEALSSNNYVIGDISQSWFIYLRRRHPKKITNEDYLREKYSKYINLNENTENYCNEQYNRLFEDKKTILGVVLRGTDYKQFGHMKQPSIEEITSMAKEIMNKYGYDCFYVMTESREILEGLSLLLPKDKLFSYKAGNISENDKGLIGNIISANTDPKMASLNYLTQLYILNKCNAIIGGLCGATIVAQYKRNPKYEYINIIDKNEYY